MRRENNTGRDSGSNRGNFNNRFGSSSRSGGSRSFNDRPKELHKAICADCKAECEVPFKPSGERPVYCRDCFAKNKPPRRF
jgi:CxxC-x17-CxxC domain-containing protein